MVKGIVIWGVTALVAAIAAGILASRKNRDVSAWAAWAFLFPPAVLVLAVLPKLSMPTRRLTLDEEEAAEARADGY